MRILATENELLLIIRWLQVRNFPSLGDFVLLFVFSCQMQMLHWWC